MNPDNILLRDWFAGLAMQALIARNSVPKNGMTIEQTAYKIAGLAAETRLTAGRREIAKK